MKSGFDDPIGIKKQKPADKPVEAQNSPWSFSCPQYDERSSCFVNAGTHYGVGHKTPVGHDGNPSTYSKTLPFGRVQTMVVDEKG